ncbi:DNA repair protein RadC [Candidatus Dependentiae bacterium]|nr:DNA repair protein RadC [Candidatus Dependentiae bacterium]
MKKIKEMLSFERPREKMFKKGVSIMSNTELLAVLIGSGIKGRSVMQVAKEINKLIEKDFFKLNLKTLCSIEGVGKVKALQLIAAVELSRRFLIKDKVKIQSPESVVSLVHELKDKKQEYFMTITLDGAYNMIKKRVVSIGILNESLVHPREVFADAISDRAAAIVLIHNHPSGEVNPSNEDLIVTKRLMEAGKLLGIKILDHIIIGKEDYFSFKSKNLL